MPTSRFAFDKNKRRDALFQTKVQLSRMSGAEGSTGTPGKGEEGRAVAVQQDPKNVAELTNYIQNMLQQMQDR